MNGLRLKIPPPLVALAAAILMWLIAWALPALDVALPAGRPLAGCIALAGVAIAILGVASFRKARTTLNPMRPEKSSALVTAGIYRRTRNPMYLSLLLVLLAWGVFLSNTLAILLLPAFILYINQFQIKPEEAALTSLFGQQFLAYKSQVRRWL